MLLASEVGVVASYLSYSPPPAPTLEETLYRLKASSVVVETENGYGTGVMVSRKEQGHWVTYIWTVAHVVRDTEEKTVYMATNIVVFKNNHASSPASIVCLSTNATIDLALLRVKTKDWDTNSVTFISGAPPVIGTQVYHFGTFHGPELHHSLTTGIISYANRRLDGRQYDQLSLAVYPGSSGGGVFLRSGDCIGLVDARQEEMIAVIVPARVMEAWAVKNHLPVLDAFQAR